MRGGKVVLSLPVGGYWMLADFPDEVLVGGVRFRKAVWRQPYDDVVEQYREAAARDSAHLKVFADGTWVIDHVDADNPDMGRPVEHFFNDHPLGKLLKVVAPAAVAGLLVYGLATALTD